MKKWAPYQSLNEQPEFVAKMKYKREKIDRPHISSDLAEKINYILVNYSGETVTLKVYENGYLNTYKSTIKKIDKDNKKLLFDDKTIKFADLIDIDN